MANALAATTTAVNQYQANTHKTYEKAGIDIDNYGQKAVKDMQDMANQSDETAEHSEEMAREKLELYWN